MKLHYLASLSALAVAGMFASSANAETMSDEFVINFGDYAVGTQFNSFWGGPNAAISIVENPDDPTLGNVLFVSGQDGVNEDTGLPVWNTLARVPGVALPKGYNLSHVLMIEVNFMTTQDDGVPFGIQLRNPDTDYLINPDEAVVDEWNLAVFAPEDFTTNPDEDGNVSPFTSTSGSFDLCLGCKGSTNYYVRDVTFYLEKEVTQREKDEANLDKATAACVSLDFNDLPVGPSEFIGSNGGMTNREDMVFDMGPEGYDNMCAHIIYGGHTNIFLWNMTEAPEGYTFDDLRLVEYDIYQIDEPGVDCTNGNSFPGAVTPQLKVKQAPWQAESNSSTCGNVALQNGVWTHVEFAPSQLDWPARSWDETVGEGDDAETIHHDWTPEETHDFFNTLTKFSISIGGFPCLNQVYVDNVKLWFQKSGDTAVETIASEAAELNTVTVFNLQGICVLRNADKASLNSLPAGLYIINGKKQVVK